MSQVANQCLYIVVQQVVSACLAITIGHYGSTIWTIGGWASLLATKNPLSSQLQNVTSGHLLTIQQISFISGPSDEIHIWNHIDKFTYGTEVVNTWLTSRRYSQVSHYIKYIHGTPMAGHWITVCSHSSSIL